MDPSWVMFLNKNQWHVKGGDLFGRELRIFSSRHEPQPTQAVV